MNCHLKEPDFRKPCPREKLPVSLSSVLNIVVLSEKPCMRDPDRIGLSVNLVKLSCFGKLAREPNLARGMGPPKC